MRMELQVGKMVMFLVFWSCFSRGSTFINYTRNDGWIPFSLPECRCAACCLTVTINRVIIHVISTTKDQLLGLVVSAVASQEGSQWRGSFCVEFPCSPCACVGFLQVLRLPPTVQRHVRLIDGSKLPVGVIVSVHGCWSTCGSVMHWWLDQGGSLPFTQRKLG